MDMTDIKYVTGLKSNMHVCFDSEHGKEVLRFLENICHWTPNVLDSNDTNDIIARDASRKILGTIKTILTISPEQIVALAKKAEGE